MESYSLAKTTKTMSTLESDDACGGGGHRSFAPSRYDSGICSMTDCLPSYGPGGVYRADSTQTSVDGIHASLLDQLNKLNIETDFPREGLNHIERPMPCHPFGAQDMGSCDPYHRQLMSPAADPFQQDEDGDT